MVILLASAILCMAYDQHEVNSTDTLSTGSLIAVISHRLNIITSLNIERNRKVGQWITEATEQ